MCVWDCYSIVVMGINIIEMFSNISSVSIVYCLLSKSRDWDKRVRGGCVCKGLDAYEGCERL